jgi:hypothetical protein
VIRKTFASRHEAFAAFVLAQFLPQHRWEIPEADFSEWTQAAGSEFQNVSQVWFLIYCAWLFRLASIHRYGYDFQRDVMTALRMRPTKHNAAETGLLKDLPNTLGFGFRNWMVRSLKSMQIRPSTVRKCRSRIRQQSLS